MKSLLIQAACLAGFALAAAAQTSGDAGHGVMGERAFEGAQWIMATKASRAVAEMGARAAQGDGPLADLIRRRQQAEADLTKARSTFAEQSPAPSRIPSKTGSTSQSKPQINRGSRPETKAAGLTRQDLQQLEQSVIEMDQAIRSQFPRYAEFAYPKPLDYSALRTHMRPGEGLVMFLSAPFATYVWAVSHDRAEWLRADISAAELSNRIRALRAGLDQTAPLRGAVPMSAPIAPSRPSFDTDTAHALYLSLLDPLMPVLEDVDHLFVVKDGPLASLPLSVLLSRPVRTDIKPAWLIKRFAFTTLPGVSSLASIRAPAGPVSAAPNAAKTVHFVGFGNPRFDATAADHPPNQARATTGVGNGGALMQPLRKLPALPGTARELREISGLFAPAQVAVFTGLAATETAVKSAQLDKVSIVSFATHGLISGDLAGLQEPALAFTPPAHASDMDDGLLTASEASELKLNADWVILSACNTAAGDGTPGAEGLSGLARAFLFAGARAILVSHWPVRDDVAARLTKDSLARLQEDPDLGKAGALRLAMLDLMADSRDPSLAQPAAWAPFVLVGEGGASARP